MERDGTPWFWRKSKKFPDLKKILIRFDIFFSFEKRNFKEKIKKVKFPLAFNVEKAYINQGFSDDSEEEIPVLVPNTEVKLFCADDSWLRACENRTLLSLFFMLESRSIEGWPAF